MARNPKGILEHRASCTNNRPAQQVILNAKEIPNTVVIKSDYRKNALDK